MAENSQRPAKMWVQEPCKQAHCLGEEAYDGTGGGGCFMAVLLSEQHRDNTHMVEQLPTTQPCTSVQL